MTMPVPIFSCFCESEIIHVPAVACLGCVFNRKSHPFMCMCRYSIHVIKPMQITAFTYAKDTNIGFGKGKNMRLDLKGRQCNALRTMILQESFGEIWTETKHRSKHRFIHTPQPFHTPRLPGSSPSPCWMIWRFLLKSCLPKVSSKPQHYLTARERLPKHA